MSDATSRYAGGQGNGTNPLTQQAGIVVNSTLDYGRIIKNISRRPGDEKPYYPPMGETDDTWSAMVGEIALRYVGPDGIGSSSKVSKSAHPVITALNLFGKETDSLRKLKRQFVFGGVLLGTSYFFRSDASSYGKQRGTESVSSLIGGTTTIINTGKKAIRPGDKIKWDLPSRSEAESCAAKPYATGARKIVPMTVPYRGSSKESAKSLSEFVEERQPHENFPHLDRDEEDTDETKAELVETMINESAVLLMDFITNVLPFMLVCGDGDPDRIDTFAREGYATARTAARTKYGASKATGYGAMAVPLFKILNEARAAPFVPRTETEIGHLIMGDRGLARSINDKLDKIADEDTYRRECMDFVMKYYGVRSGFPQEFVRANKVRVANRLINSDKEEGRFFTGPSADRTDRLFKSIHSGIFERLMKQTEDVIQEESSDVIGVALSPAAPGEPVDILM